MRAPILHLRGEKIRFFKNPLGLHALHEAIKHATDSHAPETPHVTMRAFITFPKKHSDMRFLGRGYVTPQCVLLEFLVFPSAGFFFWRIVKKILTNFRNHSLKFRKFVRIFWRILKKKIWNLEKSRFQRKQKQIRCSCHPDGLSCHPDGFSCHPDGFRSDAVHVASGAIQMA